MNDDLNIIWGPIRVIFEKHFWFSVIKQIVALAGFDITLLSHLQPMKGNTGASRGEMLTFIDSFIKDMEQERKRQFIIICTEEILRQKPDVLSELNSYLSRLGWVYHESYIIPIDIFDPGELPELPNEAHTDLIKAATRLRDGDLSGAISAACAAIDSVTGKIYSEKELGDIGNASFQERVNKSLRAIDVSNRLNIELTELGWEPNEITQFIKNLEGSINQSAYVMQKLRSKMGDVHGSKPTVKPLVFDSIKWALIIIRLFGHS
jgi:hypothetical protein